MVQTIIELMIITGLIGGILALFVGFIGAVWQGIRDRKK